ncbi:MAG: HEAT repeat domain-containing protein [Proteobacteria bacterium]|nr:HEAT repeat domain-containing protein [Pseudomonadota bacterium]MDA0927297.1 HEAT repeat domain-containing protein [Pseudomonadota bacterium]
MNSKALASFALGATLTVSAQVFSQDQATVDYREGYNLVLEQQWSSAREYFDKFLNDWADSPWADDAAFWTCYSAEQEQSDPESNFTCYQQFVNSYANSSWVADARTKMAVLGSELGELGYPEFLSRVDRDWDFDFDFDFDFDDSDVDIDVDEISRQVERAMARAEREMERVRIRVNNLDLPDLPELPELPDLPDFPNISAEQMDEYRAMARDAAERARALAMTRRRSSADEELLTIIGALREDERASDILIQRLESSDNPTLRSRIVMLLEDLPGESITNALLDVVDNDASEQVRTSAILVLLDRDDPASRERLLAIATDADYPRSVRAEILGEMDNWDEDVALDTLAAILRNEDDISLIAEAADALSDMESEASLAVLIESFEDIEQPELRREILDEIADMDLNGVLPFLSEVALSDVDDDTAATAIEGIADREDSFAVSALENIYASTDKQQRRLAALEGIGDTETQQAVDVLIQILDRESEPVLVAAAVRALGDTEQESAVAPAIQAYRDYQDVTVRNSAVRALRRLEDHPAAIEAMLEILEDRLNETGNGDV